jgi:hypothetical protein
MNRAVNLIREPTASGRPVNNSALSMFAYHRGALPGSIA